MLSAIKSCVISHMGMHRQNHEDNFLISNGDYITKDEQELFVSKKIAYIQKSFEIRCNRALFAVSDGMGGHNSGEVASLIAVKSLYEDIENILSSDGIDTAVNRFQSYVNKVNNEICSKSKRNSQLHGMGATLSSLIIFEGKVVGINIGDSRIYKYDGCELFQITKDQTEGQRLLDLKLLSEEEVKSFKSRKALSRYLGMNEGVCSLKGEVSTILDCKTREWYLLCTDGLTDVLSNDEINLILSNFYKNQNLYKAANELVENALRGTANKQGGVDNITVMLVEVLI